MDTFILLQNNRSQAQISKKKEIIEKIQKVPFLKFLNKHKIDYR